MRNSGMYDNFDDRKQRREWSQEVSFKEKLLNEFLLKDAQKLNNKEI